MDLLIGRSIGPYTITAKLGEGGMAVVYKAHQPSLNRDVAIKILTGPMAGDDEFVNRFRREAIFAGSIGHPHILIIHDAGFTDDGLHYIVMELATGGTLKDLLESGPLPPERASAIAAQVAGALQAAHEHGIVHRDLKPSNILFARDGRPLLADFGVAMTSSSTRLTRSGTAVGTPEYMSPEQAQGLAVDGRSDVYSLGVLLYEMLTGDVPFVGDTPLATLYQQVHQEFSAATLQAAQVPAALRAVVHRALAKDPDERFADAASMAAALRGEAGPQAGAAPAPQAAAPTRRVQAVPAAVTPPPAVAKAAASAGAAATAPARRGRAGLWAVVALAAVAVVAGLTYVFFFRGSGPAQSGGAALMGQSTATVVLSGDAEATVAAMVQQTATSAASATSQAQAAQVTAAGAESTRIAGESATRQAVALAATAAQATAQAEAAALATQTALALLSVEERQTAEAAATATAFVLATEMAIAQATGTAVAQSTASAAIAATQTAQAVATQTPTSPPPTATPVPLTATPVPERRSVISGFEVEETWQRGDEPYGTLTRSTEQAYGGSYSGKLAYNFPSGDNDYVVFLRTVPLAGEPDQLLAWVYGDGSGHYLNAWIGDAGGQIWQTSFGQVKHSGWAQMTASLRPGQPWPWGSVSGPDNGVVDYPVDFRAIVLDDAPDDYVGQGAIYLDRLITELGAVAEPGQTPAATARPTAGPAAALSGTIAFPVFNTQRGKYDIYLASPDGSNRRIVMQEARQPDLRDDGRLAVNGDGGGRDNIWSMNRDGGDARAISRHPEDAHPSWSGDGGRIAFDSLLGPDKSAPRLYVHDDLSGNNEPRMVMFGSYEIRGRVSTWLSDGRVVFNGCNYWDTGGDCGLYAVWDSGGQPARLTSSADDTAADAGAGGQRIAFMSRRDGNWEVYVMNWDGGDQQNLSRSPGNDGLPAWSPDGQWIAFVSDRSGQWAVWAMRPDGSDPRQLFALQGGFGAGDYDWALERLSWGP